MAEKCTKTSSPVERWINPYPFAPLNHFTVPFSLTEKLLSLSSRIVPRISSIVAPANRDALSGDRWNSVASPQCRRNRLQRKRLLGAAPRKDIAARTFGALDHRSCFYGPTQDVNLPY